MKVSDLRIGNFISWDLNDPRDDDDDPYVDYGYTECRLSLWQMEEPDRISPIELTEEWLVKLGFVCVWSGQGDGTTFKSPNNAFHLHTHDPDQGYNFGWEYLKEGNPRWELISHKSTTLTSVHQLQNLYFALTGDELTIK